MKENVSSKKEAKKEQVGRFIQKLIYQLKDWQPKINKSKKVFYSIFN